MKPEIWQDEKVGDLSLSARLLLVGLITMADDEGRLRALPSLILGHVFPYDDVGGPKLKRWLAEIEDAGLVLFYAVEGKPYLAFRNWARHQKPNRPTESSLPAPPDPCVVSANSLNGSLNGSVSEHGGDIEDSSPRAQARGSVPFPSDPKSFKDWLEHYHEITGRTKVEGSKPARDAFAARRKDGYSLDDLKLATVGCHSDKFCRENGHDVPETILRASKVTRYIELGRKRNPQPAYVDA